jgi:benzoyl-CoA reductase subunit D
MHTAGASRDNMRFTDDDEGPAENERFVTAGVDIGMRAVKVALLEHGWASGFPRVLAREIVNVPRRPDVRDAQSAVREGWFRTLRRAGLAPTEVALVASTGQAHALARVGRFYRGLSLAAGVRFLFPRAVAVLDVGARQIRCTRLETSGCRRGYAATPKEEGWGADALDTIARSSGVSGPDVVRSPMSIEAYEGVAARASKLMKVLSLDGPTVITGAMAADSSFLHILARRVTNDGLEAVLLSSPDAVFTGAYGAALLAARRFLRATNSRRPRIDVSVGSPSSLGRTILN